MTITPQAWKAAAKRVNLLADSSGEGIRGVGSIMLATMFTRIGTLSVLLVLLTGMTCPASIADDEESMDSIWADQTKDKTPAVPMTKPAAPAKPIVPAAETPVKTAPAKIETTKLDTTKVEPAKVETIKVETIKVETKKVDPVKPEVTKAPEKIAPGNEFAVEAPTPAPVQTVTPPPTKAQDLAPARLPQVAQDTDANATSTAAPMSKVDEFGSSHFIRHGGWPGVGPFQTKDGSNDSYIDQSGNNLSLSVNDGQITQATLNLVNKGTTYEDFLDLEIASDFFLEGLNIKPKVIMEFNQYLEDAKDAILNKPQGEISISAGRILATISKQGDGSQVNYVVSIASKDANRDILKEHAGTSKNNNKESIGQKLGSLPFLNKSAQPKPTNDFIVKLPPATTATPATSSESLNDTFAKTVQSWQDIKKVAVRQRKTEELSQVLSGKALIRQTDAIKWLTNNHKYYDMNPKGITVERYNEITPEKKYAVFVEIKEISKLVDDANGQVIKEQDDSYKVNYTIEKINGHYYITDSQVVDKLSAPAITRSQGKTGR